MDKKILPEWYKTMSDDEIIQGEALFWSAIAERYADEPAIFCFDLQNEPFINWVDNEEVLPDFGCLGTDRKFCYIHMHFKEVTEGWGEWVRNKYSTEENLSESWGDYPRGGETWEKIQIPSTWYALDETGAQRIYDYDLYREDLAFKWTEAMVEAIRKYDERRLVTIGMLTIGIPFPAGIASGFNPHRLAPLLDFVAIHLYPTRSTKAEDYVVENKYWLEMLLRANYVNKPIIVEEWYLLGPSLQIPSETTLGEWFTTFLNETIDDASGWICGGSPFFYEYSLETARQLIPNFTESWDGKFSEYSSQVKYAELKRAEASDIWKIEWKTLFTSREMGKEMVDAYIKTRRTSGDNIDFLFY